MDAAARTEVTAATVQAIRVDHDADRTLSWSQLRASWKERLSPEAGTASAPLSATRITNVPWRKGNFVVRRRWHCGRRRWIAHLRMRQGRNGRRRARLCSRRHRRSGQTAPMAMHVTHTDRKTVVTGKRMVVRVGTGGRRIIKKQIT